MILNLMVLNRVRLFLIGVGLSAALPVLPPAAGVMDAAKARSPLPDEAASEILNHESLISSLIQTSKSAISEVSVEVVPLLLVGMLAFVSLVAYITYRVATQRRLKAKFDAYRPTDLKNEATRHHRSESCPAETTGCAAESTPPHSAYAPNEAFRGHSLSVPFAVGSAAATATSSENVSKNVPPPRTPRIPRSRMLPPSPPKEDDHHDDDSDLHRFIANVRVVRQHSSLFKLPQHSPVPSTLGAIEEPAEAAHEAAAAASAEAAAESSSDMVLPLASSSLRRPSQAPVGPKGIKHVTAAASALTEEERAAVAAKVENSHKSIVRKMSVAQPPAGQPLI